MCVVFFLLGFDEVIRVSQPKPIENSWKISNPYTHLQDPYFPMWKNTPHFEQYLKVFFNKVSNNNFQ